MSVELKIKSKHLSVEAQIIRFEEAKLYKQFRWSVDQFKAAGHEGEYDTLEDKNFRAWYSLNKHRRVDVRNENRATYLARAYIAGKAYKSVEQKRKPEREYDFYQLVLPRVLAMIKKYDNANLDMQHVKAWVETE